MSPKNKHVYKIEELQKKMAKETGMSHDEVVKSLDSFLEAIDGIHKKMTLQFFEQVKESGSKNVIAAAMSAPLSFLMSIINIAHKEAKIEPNVIYPDLFDAYERLLQMIVTVKPAFREMPWEEFQKLVQKRYKDMGNFPMEK